MFVSADDTDVVLLSFPTEVNVQEGGKENVISGHRLTLIISEDLLSVFVCLKHGLMAENKPNGSFSSPAWARLGV